MYGTGGVEIGYGEPLAWCIRQKQCEQVNAFGALLLYSEYLVKLTLFDLTAKHENFGLKRSIVAALSTSGLPTLPQAVKFMGVGGFFYRSRSIKGPYIY